MRPRQDMCADFVMGTANTAAWARFRPPGLPAVMRVEYLSDQWRCAKAGLGPRRLSNAIDRTTTGDLRYLAHPNTPQAVATERHPPKPLFHSGPALSRSLCVSVKLAGKPEDDRG